MGYISDILAFVAIIVSMYASISANKLAHKQIELSVDQSEVGNQLAFIDKRIELYLFLKSVQEKINQLYNRAYDEHGNRKKNGINSSQYIMYYIFGLDLFMDLNVKYENLSNHDRASLLASLSRLDRYIYYSEVFWENEQAVKFIENYKEFHKDVIHATANKNKEDSGNDTTEKQNLKNEALDQMIQNIQKLKNELDQLPLQDLKQLPKCGK